MKINFWILLFIIALAGNLVGLQMNNVLFEYGCKPLIVPALMGYFYNALHNRNTLFVKWVLLALFFSWLGDVLLMFVPNHENFFLTGLASFLAAHVFYIIFFHKIRLTEGVKPTIIWLLLVVAYYVLLIHWLTPYLGKMALPVRIYGVIISFMLMLALHMPAIKNKTAGLLLALGALLFVLSDSILAINKFYQPFYGAGLLIMLSYGLAQCLLVNGAIKYLNLSK